MPHVPPSPPQYPAALSRTAQLAHGRRAGLVTETVTSKERIHRLVQFGEWLTLAAPAGRAYVEWYQAGAAWLRPGDLWTAVTVPATLVHAAVDRMDPQECVPLLARALAGGPMFYRPAGFGRGAAYTALLRVAEGRLWCEPGTRARPPHAVVLVPAPGACAPAGKERPWWVVPGRGASPAELCSAARLAELVAVGWERVTGAGGGPGE